MSTPKDSLRSVVIFSTCLGPQGTASSSGLESAYPGNWLPSPIWAQHWGILVQDEEDPSGARDTFFELYRPRNTIDVLRRSRADREAFETANPRSVYYEKTDFVTNWSDDEIEKCGKNICSQNMNGTYVLLEANCQTLANLLAQRIAFGSDPMVPYQTISHYLGGGLSRKNLFALNEFDQARPRRLKSILSRETTGPRRDSSEGVLEEVVKPSSANEPANAANVENSDDELIDLDEANRRDGPLHLSEVRSSARFYSHDSTSSGPKFTKPPPFSLGEGYHEWAKSQRDISERISGPESPYPVFEKAPERFPGPDSPYIKWVKDESRNHFLRAVEYQRGCKAREEGMKLWHDPNIPEEMRAKVMEESATKENQWIRNKRLAMWASRNELTSDGQDSNDDQNPENNSDVKGNYQTFENKNIEDKHSEDENLEDEDLEDENSEDLSYTKGSHQDLDDENSEYLCSTEGNSQNPEGNWDAGGSYQNSKDSWDTEGN